MSRKLTTPRTFKTSADVFYALRDVRADAVAERRKLEESGMYTSDGLADALDSSARLYGWRETIEAAQAAVARHKDAAARRLEKARAAATAKPASETAQLLAEQRLARKIPLIQSKIDNPGPGLHELVAGADDGDVAALVDYLRDVAASGHTHASFIEKAISTGVDARDPAIGEAAEQATHAAQLASVLSVQFAGTQRVLESGGVRADTVSDHQIDTGTADAWDVKLDAA